MGIFGDNKSSKDTEESKKDAELARFFDDDIRDELREYGRRYFERTINESAKLFHQDLNATVNHINTELRQRVAQQLDSQFDNITRANDELRKTISRRLDEKFAEYGTTIKDAQDLALKSVEHSAKDLEAQHRTLGDLLKKSLNEQEKMFKQNASDQQEAFAKTAHDSAEEIKTMKIAHETALNSLTDSAKAIEQQHQQMSTVLQETVKNQKDMLIGAFEDNMSQVVEHYLLEALGEQYDVKAQLPAILKELESNKKDMSEDLKL